MNNSEISIIMADDHQIFLDGLNLLFQNLNGYKVIGLTNSGEKVSTLINRMKPTIALLDLSMSGVILENLVDEIQLMDNPTKLIALTMEHDASNALQLLMLGFSGYVCKDTAFEDLIVAIETVELGNKFISPSVDYEMQIIKDNQEMFNLTKREKQVLLYAAQGSINKNIAGQLRISERTVCFHLSNCYRKLRVSNRSHAISKAINENLIDIS